MVIKSFVGGHPINIYTGCEFDPKTRKYHGGELVLTIPFSGEVLNANTEQKTGEMLYEGASIPVMSKEIFVNVDPIPGSDVCDYCIVSNKYVAACRSLGIDTSRLLTIGNPVVDENGNIIGCVNLNRN